LSSSCSPSSTITTISVLISMVGSRGTLAYAIYGGQFATLIEHFAPHQAITLGGLRPDLPNEVSVTTKRKLSNPSARQIPRYSDARKLLVLPNETLSTRSQRRFGNNGA
jgi:hypothetical protein